MDKIKINIAGQELTVDEAKEVYEQLKVLFSENQTTVYPIVPYAPHQQDHYFHPIYGDYTWRPELEPRYTTSGDTVGVGYC